MATKFVNKVQRLPDGKLIYTPVPVTTPSQAQPDMRTTVMRDSNGRAYAQTRPVTSTPSSQGTTSSATGSKALTGAVTGTYRAPTTGAISSVTADGVTGKVGQYTPAAKQENMVNTDKNRYINMYDQYADKTNAARDAFLKQLENRYLQDQESTNGVYDQAARQNYVTYRQNQKNLTGELNALGIRGGASESAAVRMNNAYGTNVAANDAARGSALTQLAQTYEGNVADYNREVDNQLAQAYATALENQAKYEDQQAAIERELSQQAWERQQAEDAVAREIAATNYARSMDEIDRAERQAQQRLAQEQADQEKADAEEEKAYQRKVYADQIKREEKEKEEAIKREEDAKKLEQYAAGLSRYTKIDTLKSMIDKIKKTKGWANDPYLYGKVQACNARIGEIKAAEAEAKKSGGGGGGGGGRSYRRSYGGGYGGGGSSSPSSSNGGGDSSSSSSSSPIEQGGKLVVSAAEDAYAKALAKQKKNGKKSSNSGGGGKMLAMTR